MNKRQRKKAFKTVLKSLSHVSLFRGIYDASNGDEKFMYGIQTVMELIAWYADDLDYDDMFTKNMLESERRCEHEDN